MGLTNQALRSGDGSAARQKHRSDPLAPSSAGGVFRGSKRTCTDRARWRLVRGQPAQRLSVHYQLECDYGTSILTIYNEGDPVFLCENHVAAITPRDSSIAGVRPVEASAKVEISPAAADANIKAADASAAASLPGEPNTSPMALATELEATNVAGSASDEPLSRWEARAQVAQPVASATAEGHALASDAALADRDQALAPEIAAEKPSVQAEEQAPARPAGSKFRREAAIGSSKAARDLAYGNATKALVDETIWNMAPGDAEAYRSAVERGKTPIEAAQAAGGQLAVVHRKIAEYSAKIEPILSGSKATISVGYAIDKPLEQAILEIIGTDAMAEAEKDAAVERLGAFQKQIKGGLEAVISPLQAYHIAREIGERANWGGHSGEPEQLKQAYRAVYARLRDALRAFVPEARELDERLANLYAAKSDIEGTVASKSVRSAAV